MHMPMQQQECQPRVLTHKMLLGAATYVPPSMRISKPTGETQQCSAQRDAPRDASTADRGASMAFDK